MLLPPIPAALFFIVSRCASPKVVIKLESLSPTIGIIPASLPKDPDTSFPGLGIPNKAVDAFKTFPANVFKSASLKGSLLDPPLDPPPIVPPPNASLIPSRTAAFIPSSASLPKVSSILSAMNKNP